MFEIREINSKLIFLIILLCARVGAMIIKYKILKIKSGFNFGGVCTVLRKGVGIDYPKWGCTTV